MEDPVLAVVAENLDKTAETSESLPENLPENPPAKKKTAGPPGRKTKRKESRK